MLYTGINCFMFLLDIIILLLFFNNAFTKRKPVPFFFFLAGFIAKETVSYLLPETNNGITSYMVILCTFVGTFLLTFYYHSTFRHRLFAAFTYMLLAAVAEWLAAPLLSLLTKSKLDYNDDNTVTLILLFSVLILFFLVILTGLFFQQKKPGFSLKYSCMVFVMPVFSIFISIPLFSPYITEYELTHTRILAFLGLIIANISNYYLLNYMWKFQILQNEQQMLKQQIDFQTQKYQQISSTYRSTGSMLHDVKKHFFYIADCIEHKQFDTLTDYLRTASLRLDASYNRINTGNLVIDALVSNHLLMAEQFGIAFETDIQVVNSKIPIQDYDLCIILGNLLDNSLHECQQIIPPKPRVIKVHLYTNSLEFIIHITNTLNEDCCQEDRKASSLYHGYGLQNIKQLMPAYSGNFTYFQENGTFQAIVILPDKTNVSI